MPGFCSFASMFAFAAMAMSAQTTGAVPGIPHLQKQGTATQMIVDGKPFLMLAGELRNSTTSSLERPDDRCRPGHPTPQKGGDGPEINRGRQAVPGHRSGIEQLQRLER